MKKWIIDALHGITHQWKVFGSNFYFPEEDVEIQI